MEKKQLITPAILAVMLLGGASISGCVTTDEGQGIESIEAMSEADYQRFMLYLELGVKIAANRALEDGLVTEQELRDTSDALLLITHADALPAAGTGVFATALKEMGVSNDEVLLILDIVKLELQQRGGMDFIDPVTGEIDLTPRTESLLLMLAETLVEVTLEEPTAEEVEQGKMLQQEFNGMMIRE